MLGPPETGLQRGFRNLSCARPAGQQAVPRAARQPPRPLPRSPPRSLISKRASEQQSVAARRPGGQGARGAGAQERLARRCPLHCEHWIYGANSNEGRVRNAAITLLCESWTAGNGTHKRDKVQSQRTEGCCCRCCSITRTTQLKAVAWPSAAHQQHGLRRDQCRARFLAADPLAGRASPRLGVAAAPRARAAAGTAARTTGLEGADSASP